MVKLTQPFKVAKIGVCYSLRYVYEKIRYFFVIVKNYYYIQTSLTQAAEVDGVCSIEFCLDRRRLLEFEVALPSS